MPEVAGYSFHKMSPSTDIFNDTSTGGGCKASSHYVPRARTGTSEVKPVNASAINLQEIHDFLIDIARRAGEMMLASVPIVNSVGSKKNSADLVTETDKGIEKMIHALIHNKFPNYEFLGEESYVPSQRLSSAPTFVVDPIDGTINFVHRFPNVCVSLGFTIDREPVIGVIFNPFTNMLYTAIKGKGAFLNQTTQLPLKGDAIEPLDGLSKSLVGIEWGSDRQTSNWETKIRTVGNLGRSKIHGGAMVHSMRSNGSAALTLCAVAAGTLDLWWEGGCWAWDVCAGICILKESGGILAGANPGDWCPTVDGRSYLAVRAAAGGQGQKEIVEELWSHVDGRLEYSV